MIEQHPTVVAGAGGFIGGHLVKKLVDAGFFVRAVDKKPLSQWYQVSRRAQNIVSDLSIGENAQSVCQGMDWVFQLAADMGGMGFIENFRIECMRSVLINVHMLEAAYRCGVKKFFYSSSACVYNTEKQKSLKSLPLKETDAYPAMAERGYGWEKLYSEMLCQEYTAERGLETRIARFHNVYGPYGTWDGGREKAPAALCRKVATVMLSESSKTPVIDVWGDGTQRRSFMYIDDCIQGILAIFHHPGLNATPINLGSSEDVSINEMLKVIARHANLKRYKVNYQTGKPKGVGARNSDNTFIFKKLGWEPSTALYLGLARTYDWIYEQVGQRKSGKKVLL